MFHTLSVGKILNIIPDETKNHIYHKAYTTLLKKVLNVIYSNLDNLIGYAYIKITVFVVILEHQIPFKNVNGFTFKG